jgi:hypothetical protein
MARRLFIREADWLGREAVDAVTARRAGNVLMVRRPRRTQVSGSRPKSARFTFVADQVVGSLDTRTAMVIGNAPIDRPAPAAHVMCDQPYFFQARVRRRTAAKSLESVMKPTWPRGR